MKFAVLLAGSGVYDGSEIHEAVFTLLAIEEAGYQYQCIAPNKNQMHVVNHLDGSEMKQERNVMIEAARIARGEVLDLAEVKSSDYDGLVIPGGFGAAKNLNEWATKGADGDIDEHVKKLILSFITEHKPICGLCMGPTVIASALAGSSYQAKLTVGSTEAESPYDIAAINAGIQSLGQKTVLKKINEVQVDQHLKIVTAPCYMMKASISEIRNNVKQAITALVALI